MGADEQEITEPLTTGELVYEGKMLLWGMPSAVKTCSEEMSAMAGWKQAIWRS